MVNITQRESGAKVICVFSSVPGEGKTTVATNLAAHFARLSTTRVLVIDADFHRPSLTERIAPEAQVGLKEALAEPKALSKYVIRKERLNLDVLPVLSSIGSPTRQSCWEPRRWSNWSIQRATPMTW